MVVQLMTNNSPFNALSKNVVKQQEFDCTLKNYMDVLKPILIVNGVGLSGYNYGYLPDFGRYYYIARQTTLNENTVEIDFVVDPLMSFASEIRANAGVVDRNAIQFNRYYNDNLPTYAYKTVATKAFSGSFNQNKQTVLIACGGK